MDNKNKKYRNSPVIGDNLIDCADGDIAKITRDALVVGLMWEPIDTTDAEQLRDRAVEYFNYCIKTDSRPGNMGLYSAWGISRQAVSQALQSKASNARIDIIKKSLAILAVVREKLMSEGKINPVTGIFWQKNFDGLKDVQDLAIAPANQDEQLSREEIAARYRAQEEFREKPQLPDGID